MISRNRPRFNNERPVFPKSTMVATLLGVAATLPAAAGEIAGLPANTPPIIQRPLEFSFSNDFLGRGGSVDDFRTQQFIISGTIRDRWEVTVDHSILTLIDIDEPARTDQLSATIGYRVINNVSAKTVNRLTAGIGVRGFGDFGGERIQNGSHQLVSSSVEIAAYTDLDRIDATGWLDAQRYSLIKGSSDSADWRWGYWLRGSALWASDGQLDAAAGAYGVAGRGAVDFWVGVRHDWRSGYAEPVLAETAKAEEDLAAVVGLRWGPVVFETVQQFDNKASYGQIRLLASGFDSRRAGAEQARVAFDAGITVPDVYLNLTTRWRAEWLNRGDSRWQRSLFVTGGYGEPQHEDDPMIYRRTAQAGAGIEWERRLDVAGGWTSAYFAAGGGWRQERIFGDDERAGQQSATASRGVLLGAAGLRFDAGELISGYNFRIQLGLNAVLPASDARLDMAGESFDAQRPTAGVALGLTIGRFVD
jgi:hypothetical protein